MMSLLKLDIPLLKNNFTCNSSYVKGYHKYKSVWTHVIRGKKMEPTNKISMTYVF